jgi:hypothetical protein
MCLQRCSLRMLPGWQHHPVCNSRYHFIIPSEATVEDTRQLAAVVEGKYLGRLPLHHKWIPPAPEEGYEDDHGPYNAAASVFESQDHLLHGVLHANGFGHLLRMNGSQGGSRRLIGARQAGWGLVLAGQLDGGGVGLARQQLTAGNQHHCLYV